MNAIAKSSTSYLLGLGPATTALQGMLQANGRPDTSHNTGSDKSNSLGIGMTGQNGHSQSARLRFDESTASHSAPTHRRIRVALYSHDTMGLGHLRRNLLIAQALAESPLQATTLLITGAHEANFFSLPIGADFLTLPRLHKDEEGRYTAGKLAISVQDLVSLRSESICSALGVFRPEVMIVDKVPTGAFGEMLPALRCVTENFGTKCVLGIRDVLDEPEVVRSEWFQSSHEAIEDFYDELWVYGDERIYNPVEEYGWHESISKKVRYAGYLDQASRLSQTRNHCSQDLGNEHDRLIVCALGGGQDGFYLAERFIDAMPSTGATGVLLAGPFMPPHLLRSLEERVAQRENIRVIEFTPEADQLLSRADRVVAMGGYNTVCAILSYRKPALLVPRVSPRSEQWIRAQRLEQLGLLDVIHPHNLTSGALGDWLDKEVSPPRIDPEVIDFSGLERVAQYVAGLVGQQFEAQTPLTRGTV